MLKKIQELLGKEADELLSYKAKFPNLHAPERSELSAALWSRFWRRPADLVIPEDATAE